MQILINHLKTMENVKNSQAQPKSLVLQSKELQLMKISFDDILKIEEVYKTFVSSTQIEFDSVYFILFLIKYFGKIFSMMC